MVVQGLQVQMVLQELLVLQEQVELPHLHHLFLSYMVYLPKREIVYL
jgi:hypothetical protein